MKVYISGKIGNLPEAEYTAKFAAARDAVMAQGHTPICPVHDIDHNHPDVSWQGYMRRDIKALCDCDAILLLSDWQDSKGAGIEADLALGIGLKPFFVLDGVVPTID